METLELVNGYDRHKVPEKATFRRMTVREAKALGAFNSPRTLYFQATDGTYRECRVNGAPKTWKTRPGHVKVPIKYGMYECGYAEAYGDSEDAPVSLLLVKVASPVNA